MKKMLSIVLALTTTATLSACGTKAPETPSDPAETPITQVKNPVHYGTAEQVQADTGILLVVPENAADVQFASIDGEPNMAQVSYELYGLRYTYRAVANGTAEDISGMYYSWSNESVNDLNGNAADLYWLPEQQGHITWLDKDGIRFDLSMDSGASEDALLSAAKAVVDPQNEKFAMDFSALLTDFYENANPGTAGISLRYAAFAAQAADLFTEASPTPEQVTSCMEGIIEALPGDQMAGFAAQLSSAKTMFGELTSEHGIDLLNGCGYTPKYDSWNAEALQPLFDAMSSVIPSAEIYRGIIEKYRTALENGADKQELETEDLNYLAGELGETPLDTLGVAVTDLDWNGIDELIIGTISEDDFLGKLVLDIYTLDEMGMPKLLFRSGERDRLYYAGDRIFANVGSNSAFDSFDRAMILEDGNLTPAEGTIAPEEYTQLELTPINQW